ncbi:MAG: cupin domain-containing protein, partial [Thaumarchaeota archaeon]|nr:cupin domain-containing protein [Nitrososphaerota archaeon]
AEGVLFSRSTVGGGVVSAWHHHGERHLYGFLISGRMRLEFGPKGKDAVELSPGDFFSIPPGLIHRDVNMSKKRKVLLANMLLGGGPAVVDVKAPEA